MVKRKLMKRIKTKARDQPHERINIDIRGEPAVWLREMLQSGLAPSKSALVVQALREYHEGWVEARLRKAQLENLSKKGEDQAGQA